MKAARNDLIAFSKEKTDTSISQIRIFQDGSGDRMEMKIIRHRKIGLSKAATKGRLPNASQVEKVIYKTL